MNSFCGEEFFTGCNYWASHAGTRMWQDWNETQVNRDFALFHANGIRMIRVFPLWSDFQPLRQHCGWTGTPVELCLGEEELPDTPAGQNGMDERMIARFEKMLDLAETHGLSVIVGLLTGWMSGRLHVPEAFVHRNIIEDPLAVKWEVKFVSFLVGRFKAHPAVAAWDLGNECNCLGKASTPAAAWNWSHAISSAIRVQDPTRPVISGMHSLGVFETEKNAWTIADQAETTDILTTHPYPEFTPWCNMERLNSFKNAFHAVAETRLYADIAGKKAFVEEAGNLGPALSSHAIAGNYLRNLLWNTWTHDCKGVLWWCAHEQTHLTHNPYRWNAMERQLGLFDSDMKPRATMQAIRDFTAFLADRKLELAPFRRDAIVILTHDQDSWAAAYGAFLLAKKANFDIEFMSADQKLKKSQFYILPSLCGFSGIYQNRYRDLLDAVKAGATLLVTSDGGALEPFQELFGMELQFRRLADAPLKAIVRGREFTVRCRYEQIYGANGAEVLGTDQNGNPVLSMNPYGKGRLLFCTLPLETAAVSTLRDFDGELPLSQIVYRIAAEVSGIRRIAEAVDGDVTLTEHPAAHGVRIAAVNNAPHPVNTMLKILDPRYVFSSLTADSPCTLKDGVLSLRENSGAILDYRKIEA